MAGFELNYQRPYITLKSSGTFALALPCLMLLSFLRLENIAEKKEGHPTDKIFQTAETEKILGCFFFSQLCQLATKTCQLLPRILPEAL